MQSVLHTSATSCPFIVSTLALLYLILSFFLCHHISSRLTVRTVTRSSIVPFVSFLFHILTLLLNAPPHPPPFPPPLLLLPLLPSPTPPHSHPPPPSLLLLILLLPLVVLPATMDDPRQRRPDITTAKLQLDWEPRVPVRDGLAKAIEYFSKVTHRFTDLPHYTSY